MAAGPSRRHPGVSLSLRVPRTRRLAGTKRTSTPHSLLIIRSTVLRQAQARDRKGPDTPQHVTLRTEPRLSSTADRPVA